MKSFWIWQRTEATTHHIGAYQVTPIVHSIGLRWRRGGWLWLNPLAVNVKSVETGNETRVPIPNITRNTIWFFYVLTIAAVVVFMLWRRNKSSRKG